MCGLTRADPQGHRDGRRRARDGQAPAHPHGHRRLREPPARQAAHRREDAALERAVAAVKHARNLVEDVEFYAEDAGRADPAFLYRMIEAVISAGATVVNIPDTTGYAYPEVFGGLIARPDGEREGHRERHRRGALPQRPGHGDRQRARGRLRGRAAGRVHDQRHRRARGQHGDGRGRDGAQACAPTSSACDTDIKTREITRTSRLVSSITGINVQPNKAIVGANAFAHSQRHPPGRRAQGALAPTRSSTRTTWARAARASC